MKNIKILMYGNISKLESTMNHHFLDQLTLASDEITQEPTTINELNDYIKDGNFTHVLIPDEHFHKLKGNLKHCIVPVIEFLGDHWIPWAIERKKKYIKENGIHDVIVVSERFKEPYKKITRLHTVLTGFDSSVFKNNNLERKIDVLIHGSLGEDTYKWVYPVRNWLAEILPEIGIEEGINVVQWKHPGYWFENNKNNNFTKQYSEILNKSKIAIGGSSYWRLPLKKFYEIPACGAILLSDIPLEDRDFFNKKILEIDPGKIKTPNYKEIVKKIVMGTLEKYDNLKSKLQPFRTKEDVFNRSYHGRALEIRSVLSKIY